MVSLIDIWDGLWSWPVQKLMQKALVVYAIVKSQILANWTVWVVYTLEAAIFYIGDPTITTMQSAANAKYSESLYSSIQSYQFSKGPAILFWSPPCRFSVQQTAAKGFSDVWCFVWSLWMETIKKRLTQSARWMINPLCARTAAASVDRLGSQHRGQRLEDCYCEDLIFSSFDRSYRVDKLRINK